MGDIEFRYKRDNLAEKTPPKKKILCQSCYKPELLRSLKGRN
jgi:hypothetical protein